VIDWQSGDRRGQAHLERKAIKVGKRYVFEPGDVEGGLVTGEDVFVTKFPPTTFRIGVAPRFFALVSVLWIVEGDEVFEVFEFEWILL
jgi:hypothetical protein